MPVPKLFIQVSKLSKEMAYNLRSRKFQEDLLAEDDGIDEFGTDSSEEEDQCEEMSEYSDASSCSEDIEGETSTCQQQSLQRHSRTRGRPRSILTGLNGYKWSTNLPKRASGRYFKA